MKKILLSSTLLTLLCVTNIYGEAQKYERMTGTSTTSDSGKTKFGVHLYSIISGRKFGGFVEYKMNEALGLQTGFLLFNDAYLMKSLEGGSNLNALVTPSHMSVPLIARFYPGEERQFCMFAGLQINHLTGGSLMYLDEDTEFEDIASILLGTSSSNEKKHKIKDTSAHKEKISYWGAHFLMGFDYEYLSGFQLGLEYGLGLSSLAKCKETSNNFTLKSSLGYNFAKLFN